MVFADGEFRYFDQYLEGHWQVAMSEFLVNQQSVSKEIKRAEIQIGSAFIIADTSVMGPVLKAAGITS